MYILFNIVFIILIVIFLPEYLIKRKIDKEFKERLGVYGKNKLDALKDKNVIWIHAVSVGETAASEAFLESLRKEFPNSKIVISNVTQTGKQIAKKIAKDGEVVIYFPFDLSSITEKVVSKINPKIFITVDTEIWPNLINTLSEKRIPIALINGRISDRSFRGYSVLKAVFKKTFEKIDLFCMQTHLDAQRVEFLGARPESIFITGNIKFDSALKLEKDLSKIKEKFKNTLNFDCYRNIFIAGSTHHGEEEIIAKVFSKLKNDFKDLTLIVAPRHIERSNEIKNDFEKKFKFKTKLFSELKYDDKLDAIVINKIGILKDLYAFSNLVFIGGSLVKHGGHNILEPAFYGKPIMFGPNVFNFRDITELFLRNNAAIIVEDENSFYLAANRFLNMENDRNALGKRAQHLIDENIGAGDKALERIKVLLSDRKVLL